jgi:hypothetical protein
LLKGIQIIGVLVGLYLVLTTLLNYKRKNYGIRQTVFFLIIWSGLTILFLNTSIMTLLLPLLSTQDMIMSVLVLGELILFLFLANQNQQISKLEKKITLLVQNGALNNYYSKKGEFSRKTDV